MRLFSVHSDNEVVMVRQRVRTWAVQLGFSLVDQTKVVTAASELARNALIHGGGGTVYLQALNDGPRRGLKLTFEDRGPGIPDISLAMRDGYSRAQVLDSGSAAQSGYPTNSKLFQSLARGPEYRSPGGNRGRGFVLENAFCVPVHDSTQTGEARRTAMELASSSSFDETEAGNVGLVVTEAARNLLKHAGGGDLLVRALRQDHTAAVEMLAIDKGPGIENIGRSFHDGYSTAGTSGTGLGAISRISSFHDIYSQPRQGTALLAQVSKRRRPGPTRDYSGQVPRSALFPFPWPVNRSAATPGAFRKRHSPGEPG